ncbi:MAG: hypothetical protein WDO24_07930 [Pseudomonadota bacterium]
MRHIGVFGRRTTRTETTAGSRARSRDRPAATIKIDSKIFPVVDLNEAGFVIDSYEGDLVVKQRIYFDLIVPVGDKEEAYRAEATIMRLQGGRMIGRFNDLRRDAQRAIQTVMAHRAPPPGAGAVPSR